MVFAVCIKGDIIGHTRSMSVRSVLSLQSDDVIGDLQSSRRRSCLYI